MLLEVAEQVPRLSAAELRLLDGRISVPEARNPRSMPSAITPCNSSISTTAVSAAVNRPSSFSLNSSPKDPSVSLPARSPAPASPYYLQSPLLCKSVCVLCPLQSSLPRPAGVPRQKLKPSDTRIFGACVESDEKP